jgi:hypothetical protein
MRTFLEATSFGGPSRAADAGDVADRSTTFQPVEGGTEHRNGEALLVAAYAGLWALLMVWVLIQWTKQNTLARRLEALEGAVANAAKAGAAPKRADDQGSASGAG